MTLLTNFSFITKWEKKKGNMIDYSLTSDNPIEVEKFTRNVKLQIAYS